MRPFREIVAERLCETGASSITSAVEAGLNRDAIRSVLRGRKPSVERAAEICDALGLELYVGPPREAPQSSDAMGISATALPDLEASARTLNRVVADAGGDPIPDDLWPVLATRRGEDAPSGDETMPPGARPVDIVRLAAAAGGGADVASEAVIGRVWFRRGWLDKHNLDPARCALLGVRGESMEPTLPDGCSVLVDRSRRNWQRGRIYVVRTEGELVVKRAGAAEDGSRSLVSDHPAWADVPWPAGAALVGEVRWMARTLG